jgi:hypothetical protein
MNARGAREWFVWDAPAGCPGAEQVLATAAEVAGTDALDLRRFESVRGRVEAADGNWQLSLSLDDGHRRLERRFSAPTCDDLARAAGIAIALALDLASRSPTQLEAPGSTHANATSSDAALAPEARPAVQEASVSTSSARSTPDPISELEPRGAGARDPEPNALSIAARALLDVGSLPDPALGAEASAGLRRGAASFLASGLLLPEQSDRTPGGGRLAFSLLAAGVRGCYSATALRFGGMQPSACLGLEYGRIEARGIDLGGAARYRDDWLAASAALELAGALAAGLFWTMRTDALVPLLRQSYFVNGTELVHRAALPGLRVGLGAGVVFE